MKNKPMIPTKRQMNEYYSFLDEAASNFMLTAEDISNLYDLSYMITWQDYERVFKPNKMHKWFKELFDRLELICLADNKTEYQAILKKLKSHTKKENGRPKKI